MKRFFCSFVLLCTIPLLTIRTAAACSVPRRVLFISSYNYDWASVPLELDGFSSEIRSDVTVNYLFMDTKHISFAAAEKNLLQRINEETDKYRSYDCLVAGDDNALKFILKYRQSLFGGVPVVFLGIDDVSLAERAVREPNVTGILEKCYYRETLAIAQRIYPKAHRLLAVVDNTDYAEGNLEQLLAAVKDTPLTLEILTTSYHSQKQIIQKLEQLTGNTIVLYLNFLNDADGNIYSAQQSAALMYRHSAVPVFRALDADIDFGLLGGFVLRFDRMGAQAAELVGHILAGDFADTAAIYTTPGSIILNDDVIHKYDLAVPADILEQAHIVHEHKSFTERHFKQIIYFTFFAVTLLLLYFLYFTARHNRVIRKKNTELVEAEKQASKANSAKTEFMSRMSHDMRTPMTAILGICNFGIEERRNEKDYTYFSQIRDSSELLLDLINDVLDIQKLEAGEVRLTNSVVNIVAAAAGIRDIISPRAQQKKIDLITQFESPEIVYILTDKQRINQIFINLLMNAVKYTPEGGTVRWSGRSSVVNGKVLVRNVISDTGVGMSPEFQKHMFEPFTRESNSLSRSEGGTGLGLAITKDLIDAMGGEISCESVPGKGTTFTVTISYGIPTAEQIRLYESGSQESSNGRDLTGHRILLCEDVDINVQIIKMLLSQRGLVVDHAENGMEGVKKVRENRYDAVLMDIRMPVMNGIEAAKRIREFDSEIPIIALSANAYAEDIQQSLAAGMDAHLLKPINKDLLFAALEKVL
jgi:signal transduction histidine kinase/CheY-like chemotaxis protein